MALSRQVRFMLVAAGIVTAAAVVSVSLRPPSPRQQFFDLRAELQTARQSADECRVALSGEEDGLRLLMKRTDSIRARIGDLEQLDRRGVPADSYRIYLETIDSFNAAVPGWKDAADSLAQHRDSCETLVRRHNELADSARVLAGRAGLVDTSLDTADTR